MEIAKGKNVLEAWKKAIKTVLEKGYWYEDTDKREAIEIQNLVIEIENLEDVKTPLQIMHSIDKFIYPTEDEIKEALFSHYQSTVYDYTYGERLINFKGKLNQLDEFVIPFLEKAPETRRALVVFYDPLRDSLLHSRNTPSLIYIWFRLNNKKLHLTAHIRSADLFLGFPTNIYELYLIQEYIVKNIKAQKGNITFIANSAHLFSSYKELIEEKLNIKFDRKEE